jgi:mRNA interferase MazF
MKRGTIVLTPFPFTDLTTNKIRPAVVVSRSDRTGTDVVVAFMTSQKPARLHGSDFAIEQSDPDFPKTGLKSGAIVKCDKLATVDTKIFVGELGELSSALVIELDARLRYALEL